MISVDWTSHKSVAAFVDNMWLRRSTEKYPLERQWYLNIAWYMGHQNLIWAADSLYQPKAPSWRVRMVVNLLQSQVRTLAAKLLRPRSEWDVVPATTDSDDIDTAELSKQVLESEWYRLNMSTKYFETMMWMLCTGNGFLHPHWNPDEGPTTLIPGDNDVEELEIGETDVDVVSPFEIMCDEEVTIEDSQWILRTQAKDVDLMNGMYPKAELSADSSGGINNRLTRFAEHIRTLHKGTTGGIAQGSTNLLSKKVIVHHLWVKPNRYIKALRNGKMFVISNSKVLNNGVDFPYKHGQLPFIHFKEIHVPGRFWATSTLEQLMPVQADYNRTKSQLIENRNLMSRPKWLVPKNAGIPQNALTDAPGEVIEHNVGFKPEMTQPPSLPSYVNNMLPEHRLDMEDISGQHEVTRAQAPGQVRSGSGINILIEQDEVRINPNIDLNDRNLEKTGRQLLSINSQYVKETRIARIVGKNDELLVLSYIGKKLVGPNSDIPGVDYFDVRVRTVSGLPHSRAAQSELLGNLLKMKVLDGVKDRNLVLQLLGIGQAERFLDKSRVHRSRQTLELERLQGGEFVPPMQWHNHSIHLEVLNDFRNSARWDTLTPEIQQLINTHAEHHEQWMALNAVRPEIMVQKAAQIQVATQGLTGVQNGQGQQSGTQPQRVGNDSQSGQREQGSGQKEQPVEGVSENAGSGA